MLRMAYVVILQLEASCCFEIVAQALTHVRTTRFFMGHIAVEYGRSTATRMPTDGVISCPRRTSN